VNRHNQRLEVSVDNNDLYTVSFYIESRKVGQVAIDPRPNKTGGLRVDTLEVPVTVAETGYNSITVFPVSGDNKYSIGHLRFLD
jgi:hypothetical protein